MTLSTSTRRIFCLAGIAGAAVLAGCGGSDTPKGPSPMAKVEALRGTSLTLAAIAEAAAGFVVGPAGVAPRAVVFFDPQCPHCARMWEAAKPLASEVSVLWVPVSVLGPASLAQGATIMAAADPVAKMNEHEAIMTKGGRGITADSSAKSKFEDAIAANTTLLQVAGGTSIPYLVASPGGPSQMIKQAGAMPTEQLRSTLRLNVPVPTPVPEAPPLNPEVVAAPEAVSP